MMKEGAAKVVPIEEVRKWEKMLKEEMKRERICLVEDACRQRIGEFLNRISSYAIGVPITHKNIKKHLKKRILPLIPDRELAEIKSGVAELARLATNNRCLEATGCSSMLVIFCLDNLLNRR